MPDAEHDKACFFIAPMDRRPSTVNPSSYGKLHGVELKPQCPRLRGELVRWWSDLSEYMIDRVSIDEGAGPVEAAQARTLALQNSAPKGIP